MDAVLKSLHPLIISLINSGLPKTSHIIETLCQLMHASDTASPEDSPKFFNALGLGEGCQVS